jgi:FlaA1/EpsC-like NDP-sugar epimerase
VFDRLTRYRIVGIFFAHLAIVVAAYLGAFFLRFELSIPYPYQILVRQTLPALVVIRLVLFRRHHLFSGWWHYVGVADVLDILRSVTTGSICFALLLAFANLYPGFPRSVIVLEWLLTVQFLAGARVASRILHALLQRFAIEERRAVLIVASRPMAESLLRELTVNPSVFHPIGFVTAGDPPSRWIHQLPVLGSLDDLETVLRRVMVREVFIGFPSEQADKIRQAVHACRAARVAFRLISPVRDYLDRSRAADSPSLEELFETDDAPAKSSAWEGLIRDRTVMILGAAGIVGTALAVRIAAVRPRRLLLFDRNESALYYLEIDLLRRLPVIPLTPLVGDVLDDARLRWMLRTYCPDVVIHAAAVHGDTLGEASAEEVRRNNLLGFMRVLSACVEFGVQRLLLLSLDEEDIESGVSCLHRAAEHHLRQQPRLGTVASAVRFPNVVGSERSLVTRIAETLQNGSAGGVPASQSRVRVATLRTVVPLLLDAMAIAEDGDVLAVEAGDERSVEDVVRFLSRVWNLPPVTIETSSTLPPHLHPLEVGEPTEHAKIRRRIAETPPPCVTELLREVEPEVMNGEKSAVLN